MPPRNFLAGGLRSFLLYFALVGLPLLGVAGALHLGERLEAPASVKGRWRLEAPAPCLADFAATFSVAQSGPDLRLTFDDLAHTTLAGHVDGLRVTGSAAAGALALDATLNQPRGASRLLGTLTAPACGAPVNWSATRLE